MIFGYSIVELLVRLPVVFFALTIHEFMHAWSANKCGDDTAARMGRLTLNPLAHLDLFGTICLMIGPIGWAKPVPVVASNFDHETRRRDEVLVGGAGVAANLTLGIAAGLAMRVAFGWMGGLGDAGEVLWELLVTFSMINLFLGIFNLLPVPPLDGSHILQNLLPLNVAIRYSELRPYGMGLLLGLVLANQLLARTLGFSVLGYPAYKLIELVSGIDVFPSV